MKLVMLAAVIAAGLSFAACDEPAKPIAADQRVLPTSADFTVTTIEVGGKKCDIAYAYVERGGGSARTGGPIAINLGCK